MCILDMLIPSFRIPVAEYSYHEDGTLQKICFANGIETEYTYDADKSKARDNKGKKCLHIRVTKKNVM